MTTKNAKSDLPVEPDDKHPLIREVVERVVEEKKADLDSLTDLDKREKETLKEIQRILRNNNDMESNVGVTSSERYWALKNEYQALVNRPGRK